VVKVLLEGQKPQRTQRKNNAKYTKKDFVPFAKTLVAFVVNQTADKCPEP
jgi:hypothetical protein